LYCKIPCWPIGFGDDEAQVMLKKALAINPKGLDINYFYGEYLYDEGEYKKAKHHLLGAQQAPARNERPLADKFRYEEIEHVFFKVVKKLNH
jgi:hypothetical protein